MKTKALYIGSSSPEMENLLNMIPAEWTQVPNLSPLKQILSEQEFSLIVFNVQQKLSTQDLNSLGVFSAVDHNTQKLLIIEKAQIFHINQITKTFHPNCVLISPIEKDLWLGAINNQIFINRQLQENTSLRRLALTDPLTGIANHRAFWERLDAEFSRAKRYNRPLSLIMCDVDDFKSFNDQYGHQHGDKVLISIADCLDKNRRNMDMVARYGGEEFIIILPEANGQHAEQIANRLLRLVKDVTGVSISCGVACYPDNALSPTEILYKADMCLLEAKQKGKAQVVRCQESVVKDGSAS